MNANFNFHNNIIVRTPRLTQAAAGTDVLSLLQDDSFLEALYIASPALYSECLKLKQGGILTPKEEDKVKRSVLKYTYRMATRCTPFGLFSGCHVSSWVNEAAQVVINKSEIRRHTRLDMHYLCALSQNLGLRSAIRNNILYYTNNSIYVIGSEMRYVEYAYFSENRSYQICSAAQNEYLDMIVKEARAGKYLHELVALITNADTEITEFEVKGFLNELINSQILISELEPSATDENFLLKIIAVLNKIAPRDETVEEILSKLNELHATLERINNNQYAAVEGYKHIVAIVEALGVPFDEAKLFHTDIYKNEVSGGVPSGFKKQLTEAMALLNRITPYNDNKNLKKFKENYTKRYEEKEMPLLTVLDTESGIGYLSTPKNQDITPLIDDITLPSRSLDQTSITWNKLEQLLNKKILNSADNCIEILDEDVKNFELNWDNLPPSFPVMFKTLSENEIFIESCGGSSAVNLLGRFANGDTAIHQITREIAEREQSLDDNVAFAEIVHLPDDRIGNILLHPPFRKYEIPYLSNSNTGASETLELSDLYVSVKNDRVILRSEKLNKIVIPRLSNAHNYSHNALPVYQFLCDLQNQGKRGGLFFHWGGLSRIHQHFPRVKYKGAILSLAQWNIKRPDVADIVNADEQSRAGHIATFLKKWNIPRHAVLAEGDNELYIDFENDKLVNVWLEYIKKRSVTTLKEFIHSGYGVIDHADEQSYSNQMIALVQSNKPSYQNLVPKPVTTAPVKRTFALGSEWVYFKIYCGVRLADKILTDVVKPVYETLEAGNYIDNWFFIRYNDPDFHLRVRFHLNDPAQIGHIIRVFNSYADTHLESGSIWKIQNDTYNRELERYGNNSIETIEKIFHQDSIAVVNMLKSVQYDERENFRWMWAVKSVDELLKSFGLTTQQRFDLIDSLRESFAKEFNSNKFLKVQLDAKYRQHRAQLEKWLGNDGLLREDPQELDAIRALFERTRCIVPQVQHIHNLQRAETLEVSVANLLGSLIHMIVNRVITSQPRLHEMIIYDFMSRLYKSAIAIAKQTNKKKDAIQVSALQAV